MGDGYRQALEIVFEQMSLEGTFERKKKKIAQNQSREFVCV